MGVALSTTGAQPQLVVINGKGAQSYPNAVPWSGAISPLTRPGVATVADTRNPGYIGNVLQGSVCFVPLPDRSQLARYTAQVRQNTPEENPPSMPLQTNEKTISL